MDDTARYEAAQPVVARRARWRVSLAWIVPLIAALVGLSLFFERAAREGPEVVITFKSAQGIEPGRTPVRYKDVQIGIVKAVELSSDFRTAEVTVRITRRAAPLVGDGASFWIVRPRIGLTEVSGLGALFSGNYIAFERGAADRPQRRFTGLENAVVIASDTPGRRFALRSRDALRIDTGLPVYYLGMQVGQVISRDALPDGRGVGVEVFINSPYDRYVRPTTRFWNASGVDLGVRGGEVSLRTESLLALFVGGIAFENDDGEAESRPPGATPQPFTLFRDREAALARDDALAPRYAIFFDEPVEGVRRGAPVTLLGVAAGEVKDVALAADRRTGRLRARVEVTLSPERALAGAGAAVDARQLDAWVARRGLRAQLRTASLLTAQRYVAFDYFPGAAAARVDRAAGLPVLPSVPSLLPSFEAKIARLLDKVDALPLSETLADARSVLREAKGAASAVEKLAHDADAGTLPQFDATLRDARAALSSAQRMMDDTSETLVGPAAPGQRKLREALEEIARAAAAIRTLADSIESHPASLVWGRWGADTPVARAPVAHAAAANP